MPNVCEMMRAIRGQPNRGLRDLSSTMAWISASSGPFGPGFVGHGVEENSRRYCGAPRPMECEECRGAEGDGDLSDTSEAEEERTESAEEPVAQRQAGRPPATATKHDQLLLERRFSAITARTPPGPHSFAIMTARCSSVSRRSFMRESA